MHRNPFKPMFVIAALSASAGASAGTLGLPIDLPGPAAPVVNGTINAAMPYLGDVQNIRPIRGPGSIQLSPIPLPGLGPVDLGNVDSTRQPGSAGK